MRGGVYSASPDSLAGEQVSCLLRKIQFPLSVLLTPGGGPSGLTHRVSLSPRPRGHVHITRPM